MAVTPWLPPTVPTHRKIIEGIQAVAIWCLCAGFVWGIGYGLYCLTYDEARGVEAHMIHPSSVAVSREHRRAERSLLGIARPWTIQILSASLLVGAVVNLPSMTNRVQIIGPVLPLHTGTETL